MDSNMDSNPANSRQNRNPYHRQHNQHADSTSPSGSSASRCPAVRAAAEQRSSSHPLPTISTARGAAQYDPVHSHPANRSAWQSRSPQNWQAMLSPFAQDSPMSTFTSQASSSQPAQPDQPCPMPQHSHSHLQAGPETYGHQVSPYQQFRPAMHPVPHFLPQHAFQTPGYPSSNANQMNNPHFLNRSAHAGDASLHVSASSMNSMPAMQPTTTSGPPVNPIQTSHGAAFTNEIMSSGPGPHLPMPQMFAHHMHSAPYARQTSQPMNTGVELHPARPASHSIQPPASTAPQRTSEPSGRTVNPVEIRRASTAAINRARRTMPRMPGPGDWFDHGALMLRRGDMNFIDYMDAYPGVMVEGDPVTAHRWLHRGNPYGKRVASKQALASLESVNLADLPESEKTCVICYNEFGVANPEGINEAPLRLPKCKHIFGDHCIKKWFQESDSCPYCRDHVHSEIQSAVPCLAQSRRPPNFRFLAPYHISPQHLPGFQGHDQHQSRDRDASESEMSDQSAPENNTENQPALTADASSNSRQPSGRRPENMHHHSTRTQAWTERRSPPVEHDRRRRSRHRARYTPSSTSATRTSIFGGQTPSGSTQTPYHWNENMTPNANHRGGPTTSGPPGAHAFNASSFSVQSQTNSPSDDVFHDFLRHPSTGPLVNDQQSGFQQTRPHHSRFLSPTDAASDNYSTNSGQAASNQFASHQQS